MFKIFYVKTNGEFPKKPHVL